VDAHRTVSVPPGRLGLPWLGETLALLRNPFAFLDVRQRRYGPVFKSRVLGRPTVFLGSAGGAQAFYDTENVGRDDAHPYPIVDLFGGVNMEMYDGDRHRALKALTLTAFGPDALTVYLPDMERLIGERLTAWSAGGEFSATAELRKLAIEVICLNLLGLEPGAETDRVCHDYGAVLRGIVSVPLGIPGTRYGRARAARDRLLAMIRELVAARRARPTGDGLSRILTTRAPDGRTCTDDEAVLEVHHIVMAGFIVYALMAEVLRRLAEDRAFAEGCAHEVRQLEPAGGPLTLCALQQLVASTQVVNEAKRLVPLVPLAFGRARRSFSCGGYLVPEGWRVYLALSLRNRDAAVWSAPERFDPARFAPERAEHTSHPLAFIPQGAGPATGHQCLGLEYSTVLTLVFLVQLVRDCEWEVPAQDLSYRWNTIPPEPRDGLRVRVRRRG
jgi:retinoid hydroxylase